MRHQGLWRRLLLVGCLAGVQLLSRTLPALADGAEVVARGFGFVEGTIFVGNDLYFVDYDSSRVLRVHNGLVDTVWQEEGCGANGLVALNGALLVACYDDGTVARISIDGWLLQTIRKSDTGDRFVAPNDLAADARGGIYFSTSGSGNAILGKIFYRRPDGVVLDVADGIEDANGLVVSRDGKTLYVAASADQRLLAFPISPDGKLRDGRLFVNLAVALARYGAGRYTPDGVRMDRNGDLFIGLFDGGGFVILDPSGRLLRKVDLPGDHHANLAISPDAKSVYATSVFTKSDGRGFGEILKVANPLAQ